MRTKADKISRDSLTAEMARDRLSYDPSSGLLTWKVSPSQNCKAGSLAGSRMQKGYITIRLFRTGYQAHRLAWLIVCGEWPEQIDHIDGDKANNRLSNLREATNSQNQANKPYRGYFYSQRENRFGAATRLHKGKLFLGYFDTAAEARAAYLEAHRKLHGEFSFTQRTAGGQVANNAAHLSAASSPGAQ